MGKRWIQCLHLSLYSQHWKGRVREAMGLAGKPDSQISELQLRVRDSMSKIKIKVEKDIWHQLLTYACMCAHTYTHKHVNMHAHTYMHIHAFPHINTTRFMNTHTHKSRENNVDLLI